MSIDPISDMLVAIRNGIKARLVEVSTPASNMKLEIARVLKAAGYIEDVVKSQDFPPRLTIVLKYSDRAESAITGLKRESKPGLRKFVSVDKIPAVLGGMGLAILSTSKGVMSGQEAKEANVGGELVCTVW